MLKKFFLFFSLLLFCNTALISQESQQVKELSVAHELSIIVASKVKIPVLVPPPPPPSRWNGGTLLQLGFSQLSLTKIGRAHV